MEKVIELIFSLGLFVNAALFIPQGIRILIKKDATEVSFITFFGFLLIQFSAVLHGYIKKDHLLAFGTGVSMLTCGWVVFLVIYYRLKAWDKLNKV
jgi:uncharacterized protein with PQ loop repeat